VHQNLNANATLFLYLFIYKEKYMQHKCAQKYSYSYI